MNPATPSRELITVATGDAYLQGTYHKAATLTGRAKATGVLFVNSGFLPRAAGADSAVHWADSFAQAGFPSFRLDLPGLGDSVGRIPEPILDFVNSGGYAPVLAGAVKELVANFNLAGIVIVGHCAGAVSAVFTGAMSLPHCRGLVLLDPYFHLEQQKPKLVVAVKDWVMWGRLSTVTRHLFHALRSVYLVVKRLPSSVHMSDLPRNANRPLLRGWQRMATAGVPILVLQSPRWTAAHSQSVIGQFDYLSHLQAADQSKRLSVKLLPGIDHSFANSVAQAAVRDETTHWLAELLPPAEESPGLALPDLQTISSK